MSDYLPEGWTQEKIDYALDIQHKNRTFCCHLGCGWVVGECKHRTYEGDKKELTANDKDGEGSKG